MTVVSEIGLRAGRAARTLLTPSTPFAHPQVLSRSFTLLRGVIFGVSAGQRRFLLAGSIPGSSTE
jgi:hypothetical protein